MSQPAVATSTLPPTTIVIALAVLVAAALVLVVARRWAAGRSRDADAAPVRDPEPIVPHDTVAFLAALGRAMVDSGDPVTHIQETLRQIAHRNCVSATGIVVLPTALIVSLPGEQDLLTSVTVAGTAPLRLDQIDAVFALADDATQGRIGPRAGLALLQAARSSPPPFSTRTTVIGHITLTAGLAIILGGNGIDVVVAAILGAAVGAARTLSPRFTFAYQVFAPVLSAFTVAVIVFLLPRTGLDLQVLAPLIAPLVTFLPGALLTTSIIELATGQMVSGASRLAAGVMQLTLLALGILVAAQLVGIPTNIVDSSGTSPLGEAAPWVGVALFGVGVIAHQSARQRSAGWILLVLYVAYAGQVLGAFLLGTTLSAFAGALLMTPVAVYVATLPSGPATMVSFLPAFWLLVPGALGLVGLTQVLGHSRVNGVDSLLTTAAAMIGIAFGVLLGLATATGLSRFSRITPRGRRIASSGT